MKNKFWILLVAAFAFVGLLTGCGDDEGGEDTPPVQVTQYDVTFDTDGGTPTIADRKVNSGSPIGAIDTVTKTNWTFEGWFVKGTDGKPSGTTVYNSSSIVTGNLALIAKWKLDANKVAYKFDTDGGTPAVIADAVFDVGGSAGTAFPAATAVTKDGYILKGWFTTATTPVEYTSSTVVAATDRPADGIIELKASWEGKPVTITLTDQSTFSGTFTAPTGVKYGDVLGAKLPTNATSPRAKYTVAWYTTAALTGSSLFTKDSEVKPAVTTGDTLALTLYAKWVYVGGEPVEGTDADGHDTITVDTPAIYIGSQGSASSDKIDENTAEWYGATLVYDFPAADVIEGFHTVEIFYELTTTAAPNGNLLAGDSTVGIGNIGGGQWPNYVTGGAEASLKFDLRLFGENQGIGLGVNSSNVANFEGGTVGGTYIRKDIVITKVVFTKLDEMEVEFAMPASETGTAPAKANYAIGLSFTVRGAALPAPTGLAADKAFFGWKDNADATVTGATIVNDTKHATLTAFIGPKKDNYNFDLDLKQTPVLPYQDLGTATPAITENLDGSITVTFDKANGATSNGRLTLVLPLRKAGDPVIEVPNDDPEEPPTYEYPTRCEDFYYASKVTVTIEAERDGETAGFRWTLGPGTAGSGWNIFDLQNNTVETDNPLEIKKVTVFNSIPAAATATNITHFIFQANNLNDLASGSWELTIRKINFALEF